MKHKAVKKQMLLNKILKVYALRDSHIKAAQLRREIE